MIDTKELLEDFFSSYKSYRYQKRENIVLAKEKNPYVYYLVKGAAKTVIVTRDGRELISTFLGSGDIFPIRGTHYGSRPKYTFQALSNIFVRKAPKKEYLTWAKQHPTVVSFVMQRLVDRLSSSISRLQTILLGNAYQKVISALLFIGDTIGSEENGKIVVTIPLTHQEIAELIGLTRETATVEIDRLQKEKLLTVKKHTITFVKNELEKKAQLF